MMFNTQMIPNAMINILVVDDNYDILSILSDILSESDYQVQQAMSGSMALDTIGVSPPDLILLDINLPDLSGYDVCTQLKSDERTRLIPVIFISANNTTVDKVKGFSVGGVDYVSKPFAMAEVLARVENQLKLSFAQSEAQQLNQHLEQRVIERTTELETTHKTLSGEIQIRQQMQENLMHMALHDSLTDLPNRVYLMMELSRAIEQVQQQPDYEFAVIYLDCDRFKGVNDSLGHLVGDQIIIEISQRLQSCLPPNTLLARMGGDEFTAVIRQIQGPREAEALAEQFQQVLRKPFNLAEQSLFMSASMGIVQGTAAYTHAEQVLRDADTAMYQAKASGKARHQIFYPIMHQQAQERLTLETNLSLALERQEFRLRYQPIVSLTTQTIVAFEALIRWHHPEKGLISPAAFIPIAEETGFIVPLGLWVLEQACQQLKTWQQDLGAHAATLRMSVNLSVKQFSQPDLVDHIDRILEKTGIEGRYLKLEITETALIENSSAATHLLGQLKDRQIELAIDDFGTGYSSLNYLSRFPVDTLKIDRSFVNALSNLDEVSTAQPNTHHNRIVQAIITLAHDLGMNVIAEGIEVQNQLSQLQEMNCDLGQGYFWRMPMVPEEATQLLISGFA